MFLEKYVIITIVFFLEGRKRGKEREGDGEQRGEGTEAEAENFPESPEGLNPVHPSETPRKLLKRRCLDCIHPIVVYLIQGCNPPRQLAKENPQGQRQPSTWQGLSLQTALWSLDRTSEGPSLCPLPCVFGAS